MSNDEELMQEEHKKSDVSAETSAEITKEAGIDAPQGVETELPQTAYDKAYKDKYEDTARIIGAETDAARDAEPTKAGDMHSMDSVISEMSEELKREKIYKDGKQISSREIKPQPIQNPWAFRHGQGGR